MVPKNWYVSATISMLIKQMEIYKLLMIKSFLTIPGKAFRRVGTTLIERYSENLCAKWSIKRLGLGGIEVVLVECINLRRCVTNT